jgi:hypothetical protein
MSWKLLFAGFSLLPVQATPTQSTPATPIPGIIVEVGPLPMNGLWYQDGLTHVHDKVRIRPTYHPDGAVEMTVGTTEISGTDITFYFSHDEKGQTRASATTLSRSDVHMDGYPSARHLSDLEGRIVIESNDWGPGKTLNALFAIRGMEEKSPEFLVGSFSLLMRK